jgi:hypothetical protein
MSRFAVVLLDQTHIYPEWYLNLYKIKSIKVACLFDRQKIFTCGIFASSNLIPLHPVISFRKEIDSGAREEVESSAIDKFEKIIPIYRFLALRLPAKDIIVTEIICDSNEKTYHLQLDKIIARCMGRHVW